MRRIGDLLGGTVRRSSGRTQVVAAVVLDALRSACDEVLPSPLARRVEPTRYSDGVATVTAEGSVVASEVRLLAVRIQTCANRILVRRGFRTEITELRVRTRP